LNYLNFKLTMPITASFFSIFLFTLPLTTFYSVSVSIFFWLWLKITLFLLPLAYCSLCLGIKIIRSFFFNFFIFFSLFFASPFNTSAGYILSRATRCVTKQTELPKYKKIRECYEKTPFQKIGRLYICYKFCFKSFAEKSSWISAYGIENGLLVLWFVLSLPKAFTRHWGTHVIVEIMKDANSYEKRWVTMF
jgi:hypothetical protein